MSHPAPWRALGAPQITQLHPFPVLLVRNFVTPKEARHLRESADDHFKRSTVTCDKPEGCIDPARTSETAMLDVDDVTQAIQRRARLFSGYTKVEPLQAVRYGIGQEYKPHLDAFDRTSIGGRRSICQQGGRRAATMLVYLNAPGSVPEGGATIFPNLGLSVDPVPFAAIYWRNLLSDGSPNEKMRHGGAPVRSGVKYALNVWLLEPEPAVKCP